MSSSFLSSSKKIWTTYRLYWGYCQQLMYHWPWSNSSSRTVSIILYRFFCQGMQPAKVFKKRKRPMPFMDYNNLRASLNWGWYLVCAIYLDSFVRNLPGIAAMWQWKMGKNPLLPCERVKENRIETAEAVQHLLGYPPILPLPTWNQRFVLDSHEWDK